MTTPSSVVNDLKEGIKTSEFYLSSFVTLVGTIVQFLPSDLASSAVKVAAAAAAVLSAVGYTTNRTVLKNNG